MFKRYVPLLYIFVASCRVRNSHSPSTNVLTPGAHHSLRARRLLSRCPAMFWFAFYSPFMLIAASRSASCAEAWPSVAIQSCSDCTKKEAHLRDVRQELTMIHGDLQLAQTNVIARPSPLGDGSDPKSWHSPARPDDRFDLCGNRCCSDSPPGSSQTKAVLRAASPSTSDKIIAAH